MKHQPCLLEDDWSAVISFLPDGWKEKAKELKACCWGRKFAGPDILLPTLLIHLVEGCSFRETAVRAREGGPADVSDVALLKRLRAAGEWLRWMAEGVMKSWLAQPAEEMGRSLRRIRVIDGTTVQEPRSKGTSWRLHYSIDLQSLACDEFVTTGPDVGESFKNSTVSPGDLFLGDRCYATSSGVAYVIDRGGHVLTRAKIKGLSLVESDGRRFELMKKLRTLREGDVGDWDAWVQNEKRLIKGLICALKKSSPAAEAARRKMTREHHKKHGKKRELNPYTLEAAGYIFVFTTLDRTFTTEEILEI